MRQRLIEFVRALLPDGPFWRSEAAERFVSAIAGAYEDLATWVDGIRDAIYPGTAERPVLLQWWESVRSECVATPTDTDELRDRVVDALGAEPGHTPEGLQALLDASLIAVELGESLEVASVPGDVPMDVEWTGRVLEIWHSPLLDVAALVQCVARGYAPAGDALRLIAPTSEFRRVSGGTADDWAFAWQHARGTSELVVERIPADGTARDTTTYAVSEETSADTWTTIFGLLGTADVRGDLAEWYLQRDFGNGAVQVSEAQRNVAIQVDAFTAITGLVPSVALPGWWTESTAEDSVDGLTLTSNGVPQILAAAGTGIDVTSELTQAYFALRNTTDAFAVADASLLNIPSNESFLVVWAYQVNTKPSEFREMFGKREESGDLVGWQAVVSPSNALVVIADFPDVGGVDQVNIALTSAATDAGIHVAVFLWDLDAQIASIWNEGEVGETEAIPDGVNVSSSPPFTIGRGRLDSLDYDLFGLWICRGAQVEGANGAQIAQDLHAAIVA